MEIDGIGVQAASASLSRVTRCDQRVTVFRVVFLVGFRVFLAMCVRSDRESNAGARARFRASASRAEQAALVKRCSRSNP
jgi:hypothetical protein